ncbi:MAG: DUF192 domain-containing protein [Acidobacteria bacterium]|nr:DUF192 domain-containing protein [Acidobacteriota bacterium]
MSKPMFLGPLVGKGAGRYELINTERGTVLATHVEPAFESKTRRRGLLGRDSVPDDYALIIAPCSSVHTFFMRFSLDLVFVSKDGTVVKTCRSVKPWRMAGAWRAFAVIEAAAGFIDRTEIVPGEVVGLREIPERRRASDVIPPLTGTPSHEAGGPKTSEVGGSKTQEAGRPKPVTLADIIGHRTPLGWFESVAIVQEMCAAVLARLPADDPCVPELADIALTDVGGVALLARGPEGHSLVRRACLVLLSLTPEVRLPTELRLFALGGLSPTPRFKSLQELHTELEFYERPDRPVIVRGVYKRYRHLSGPAAPLEEVKPPDVLEPPLSRPPGYRPWWKRKSVWNGIFVLVLTLVAATVIWEWRRPEGRWLREDVDRVTQVASGVAHRAADAARGYRDVAWRKLGLASAEPTSAPSVVEADAPAAAEPAEPRRVIPPSPRPQEPQAPPAVPPLGPPQPGEPPAAAALVPPQPGAATPAPVSSQSPTAGAVAAAPTTVYSAADPLVVPPELLRPVLPKGPPPGVRSEDLPEVEVLVSATGQVETVKLLSSGAAGPRAAMMLSVVKTWAFKPATRAGQPVRYRYRMRLTR